MGSGWGSAVMTAIVRAAGIAAACAACAAGCTEIPPSGRPFEPVRAVRGPGAQPEPFVGRPHPAPSADRSVTPSDPGAFDFEAEDRAPPFVGGAHPDPSTAATDADPIALQEKLLGLPPGSVARAPYGVPWTDRDDRGPGPPPAPMFDPNVPLPDISFGVRVLGVVTDLAPPRAMLALPDGREIVVTPGAMVPDQGLVVLAIGRNAVQIAHVTPNGFLARVTTETVAVLAPAAAPALPVQ